MYFNWIDIIYSYVIFERWKTKFVSKFNLIRSITLLYADSIVRVEQLFIIFHRIVDRFSSSGHLTRTKNSVHFNFFYNFNSSGNPWTVWRWNKAYEISARKDVLPQKNVFIDLLNVICLHPRVVSNLTFLWSYLVSCFSSRSHSAIF